MTRHTRPREAERRLTAGTHEADPTAFGFGGGTLDWDDGAGARDTGPGNSTESFTSVAPVLKDAGAGEQSVANGDHDAAGPAREPGSDAPFGGLAGSPSGPAAATSTRSPSPLDEVRALLSREIPRFRRSERELHWSIAIPFLVCLATGITGKVFFNQLHPQTSTHAALRWGHRLSGICLLLLPTWVARRHRHDLSLYLYNIERVWTWSRDDLKWLALQGPAALNRKITLPEQHKFNAGEKLNFMALTLSYPTLVATGLLILMPGMHFLTWVVHVSVAVLAAPLVFGHLFMALVNPDTRIGLSGMFSGNVDREWARHHYTKWYRENFGEAELQAAQGEGVGARDARTLVHCSSCDGFTALTSWEAMLASVSGLRPLDCPACGSPLDFAYETAC